MGNEIQINSKVKISTFESVFNGACGVVEELSKNGDIAVVKLTLYSSDIGKFHESRSYYTRDLELLKNINSK